MLPAGRTPLRAALVAAGVTCFVGWAVEAARAAAAPADSVRRLLVAGRPGSAAAAARALLEQSERRHGQDSPQAAEALDVLVESLLAAGRSAEPETRALAERDLALRERLHGAEHALVAAALHRLASVLREAGDYPAARQRFEAALAMREKLLGPAHRDVGKTLNGMGALLYLQADYKGSEALHERARAILEQGGRADSLELAWSLSGLGSAALFGARDHETARRHYEQALAIRERLQGPDHPEVGTLVNNLANLLRETGDYPGARARYERALAIRERALGPDHPDVAAAANNLSILLKDMGDYVAARALNERALAVWEKALGPEHRNVAVALDNLGVLFTRTGDYEAARAHHERALAIREKVLGHQHTETLRSLYNLGTVLWMAGDPTGARPLLERVLEVHEKTLPPGHYEIGRDLHGLAGVLQAQGDHVGAARAMRRTLAIYEKVFGPDHPLVGQVLNNLALELHRSGEREEARPLYERCIALFEQRLGPDHPDLGRYLGNLARLRYESGEDRAALQMALRVEEIGRENLRLTTRALSEREALRLAATRAVGLDLALTAISEGSDLDPEWRVRAWNAVMASRALVLDEMALRVRAASRAESPEAAARGDSLRAARGRLARLLVRGPGGDAPAQYRSQVLEARARSEEAERALAEVSAAAREEQERLGLSMREVAAALPPGSALVGFAEYKRQLRPAAARDTAFHGPASVPSYLALVWSASGPVQVVPLGEAAGIEAALDRWRRLAAARPAEGAGAAAEESCRVAGLEARRLIWDPVSAKIGEAERVFVVPDGALHFVNLAALPAGRQRYLAEAGPLFHLLTSERDLVRGAPASPAGRGLLAVGGAAFDAAGGEALAAGAPGAGPATYRGALSRCAGFEKVRFAPLPASEEEVREIAALWGPGDALTVTGGGAREEAFKRLARGRRVLHLATHGFFLGGECSGGAPGTRGIGGMAAGPPAAESPLLFAGLALAGANHRNQAAPGQDDGILTAEEVAALDLSGVEWAVLSGCDTGVGTLAADEGVLGLRRAFLIAGARTVVTSLWSVADEAARQWMAALYRARLERRLPTADAVRAASLDLLHSRHRAGLSTHPFYWAGFVALGEWR